MSLSILNNISALSANNSMSATQANLAKTLVQLSTGMRINSGADDAAGLSIANGLTANISALTQSGQNASNATGLLQTADGALGQVTMLLNRAVTLATEASSNGLSTSQSNALDTEYQSILSTINNIGSNTNFNGAQVFSANAVTPFLSDGSSGNDLLGATSMTVGTLATAGLALGAGGSTSATNASNTLTLTSNLSSGSVTIGTQTYNFTSGTVGAGQVAIGVDAHTTLQNLAVAVAGDSHNAANTSATASVSGNTITLTAKAAGTLGDGVAAKSSLISVGGPTGSWSTGSSGLSGGTDGTAPTWTLDGLDAAMNDGQTVTIGGTKYTFVNALSENGGAANQVLSGPTTLTAFQNLQKAISGTGGVAGINYTSGTSPNPGLVVQPAVDLGAGMGQLSISTVSVGAAGDAAIGTPSDTGPGMWLFRSTPSSPSTAATNTLSLTSEPTPGDTITLGSQTYTFQTGVAAGLGQVQIGGTYGTLGNLYLAVSGNGGYAANPNVSVLSETPGPIGPGSFITFAAITPGSAGNGLTATSNITSPGGSTGSWSSSTGLANGTNATTTAATDLSNAADARAALTAITKAISTISQSRGTLGSDINRLTASSNVMTSQIQNLQGADNGIMNADIGKTVANMTQYNVLQSTGMAALQQANQAQQAVLKLLQ
jgi:flagellin